MVYHSLREDLQKKGVIFTDSDTALREHPDLVRQYFGTIIPTHDNKYAALQHGSLVEELSSSTSRRA